MRVYEGVEGRLVAACDREVLGRTFVEGGLRLEVGEGFYGGRLVRVEEAVGLVSGADVANLTGEGIVGAVVEEGLADPGAILYVEGVPHLQVVKL